jgi:hypothetical protein
MVYCHCLSAIKEDGKHEMHVADAGITWLTIL